MVNGGRNIEMVGRRRETNREESRVKEEDIECC